MATKENAVTTEVINKYTR